MRGMKGRCRDEKDGEAEGWPEETGSNSEDHHDPLLSSLLHQHMRKDQELMSPAASRPTDPLGLENPTGVGTRWFSRRHGGNAGRESLLPKEKQG